MYWQKRFNRSSKDAELEEKIKKTIRKVHENYGYRRIYGVLRTEGLAVNRKRVQRIVQEVRASGYGSTRTEAGHIILTRGKSERWHPIG